MQFPMEVAKTSLAQHDTGVPEDDADLSELAEDADLSEQRNNVQ